METKWINQEQTLQAPRTSIETSEEFRLLVAEIAEQEGCNLLEARQRARAIWGEVGEVDPSTPVIPTTDWRFVAWCLGLALLVVLVALGGLLWVLAVG